MIEAVQRDGVTRFRVTRPTGTSVVLGRGSKPDVELNVDSCLEDDVEIQRRRGGGCTVVLDPGNLVISVTAKVPGLGNIQSSFDTLTAWVIDALERVGIHGVSVRGVSDLVIGDRKVGGSCIQRSRDLLYFSTTLLVSPDVDLIDRYLAHPPREPEYRRGRSHGDFMTTLPALHGIEDLSSRVAQSLAPASELHL